MAAQAVQPTSKSAKKKAARAIERTDSPAPSVTSATADKTGDEAFESPYIKELQKNIRNVNKKITNASKTDTLLSQHPDKSLDELVASKVINIDQRAQILKKPALQAQLAQYEEQLAQHQKVDEQYRTRAATDKAEWEKNLEKAKADAVADAKEGFNKSLRDNLLVLSQFLRLAAYRREEAQDPESDESQAIEGVLLAIYSGDQMAVESMLKLVNGTEDQVVSVPGEQLQTTFSKVKSLAQDYKTPYDEAQPAEGEADAAKDIATDPTVAHAAATELEAGDASISSTSVQPSSSNGLANASVADDAANAVAESHWDTTNHELSASQEWVDVKPAEAVEAEAAAAAPAPATNTQSWADDHPEQTAETTAPADPNDGFHQVQRNRPRNEGGSHRGRGRGEWRGRGGYRGEGRGRGRGHRGAGGPPRGGRRNEES
ncbi:hypothetical protein FALBO_12276 [Fusarium albosuccineum]|uniref:YAG7-like dimerisation domain-containing protein n=1 Tax=Fusarium albosuccineum TaxID=1237068 RepID=A0A8H4P994_9HYPO|nr:hypothetical protein FALBO_12276 [Fusarium albosuccineum]